MGIEEKNDNKGGLDALKGFAFQIKVFLYYAVKLDSEEKIEFEVLEDVNIEKEKDLDKYEDCLRTIQHKRTNEVIQVKRTQINKTKIKEILLNWILLELNADYHISKYILFTIQFNKQKNYFNNISTKEIFKFVMESDETSPLSKKYQIKKIFEEKDFSEFEEIINNLKQKCYYENLEDIDAQIAKRAKTHLKGGKGISQKTYLLRIEALKTELTSKIISAANDRLPFVLEHSALMAIEEEIIQTITDKFPMLNYSEYVKVNKINLSKISDSREISQLAHCNLRNEDLKMRINRWMYYSDYRFRLREMSRNLELEDIELIAYENFNEAKSLLIDEGIDSPLKRLIKTENKTNSYAPVEPIQKGACIYLTKRKNKPEEKQISWKDE